MPIYEYEPELDDLEWLVEFEREECERLDAEEEEAFLKQYVVNYTGDTEHGIPYS